MKNLNKKGFTLVELVVVIAVIAILAGVLIGTFAGVIQRANQSKAIQEAKSKIDNAYTEYVADYHKAPESVKVTLSSGKLSGVVFGSLVTANDSYAGFTVLEDGKYVSLSNVANQDVYLNWTLNGYTIDAVKNSDNACSTPVKTYVQYQVDNSWESVGDTPVSFSLTKNGEEFSSVIFSSEGAEQGQYTIAPGYVNLGKCNGVTYYLNFSSDNEYTVSTSHFGNELTVNS